jgi:SAM-dependent methyltransferase
MDDADAVPIGNTYDKYASSNPIERRLMQGFFDALDDCLPATAPRAVLEVGVGEGEVARRLRARWPQAMYIGVDLPDAELAAAWRSDGLPGVFADISHLPYVDGQFDLVLAIEVLEHVPDPPAAIAELARVTNGPLIASVPREPIWRVANLARGKYWGEMGNTPGHINHWSARGFKDLVSARFDVARTRMPFPWTMVEGRRRPG